MTEIEGDFVAHWNMSKEKFIEVLQAGLSDAKVFPETSGISIQLCGMAIFLREDKTWFPFDTT